MAGVAIRHADLVFDDGPLAGNTARVRLSLPLRKMIEVQRLVTAIAERPDTEPVGNLELLADLYDLFADEVLESWSLEDEDGNPVPANRDGIGLLPWEASSALFRAWNDILTGNEGNSEAASRSGSTSQAASVVMAV